MAKTTVGGELVLDFKSVGEMRKAIKEATGDVIKMQSQFGETSKEALDAAKRVAMLKDRVKEASEVADLFDPGNKFKVFGNAVQAAAGGFSALQGAMGLFGVESKEMEKQLLKVQSAMALSQGLSTLLDSGKDFSRLAAIIKTQVVTAFTTLRGAMMATGIGLLTAGIAFLIENFDKVKKVVYDMFPALKGLFDNMDRIKQIAMGVGNAIMQFLSAPISALIKVFKGDFSGAMDTLKKGVEFTKNYREGESKEIKSQAEEKEKAWEEERKKQAEHHAKLLAEQKKAAEERRKEREQAEQQYTQFLQTERERQLKAQMTAHEVELFELEKKYKTQLAIAKKYGFDTKELYDLQRQELLNIINKEVSDELKTRVDARDKNLGNFAASLPKIASYTATIVAYNKEVQTSDKATAEDKIMMLREIGNAMGALSEVIGRQTAVGKGLAVAQATINTFLGITEVWRAKAVLPEPFNTATKIAATITTAASGFAAVRNIVKTQVPGGGGGGISAPSGIDTKAPMQPTLAPTVIANVQNAQAINQMANQSTRAYVLNSDIQNNEQRNAYLQRAATIG